MVQLTHEHSVTYGGGLATLAQINNSVVDDAKVRGVPMTLRTAFSYDVANAMASSKQSFQDVSKFRFQGLMESGTYRIENQLLYGGDALGVIGAADDDEDTVTVNAASWAPGVWAAAENAEIDIYDTTLTTLRVSTKIVAIDAATKTISVTASSNLSTVVAGDKILFKGAKGNEMVGLRQIALSGQAGGPSSLYGISASAYGQWQGSKSAVGSANLTLKKIYQGLVPAVGKGLMEDVTVLVSPATFSTLANDEAALRRYNTQSKKGERGVDSIDFTGANGGISVLIHPMMRESEAIAFPLGRAERIGTSDLSMQVNGAPGDIFTHLPEQTGFECRMFSDQALFLPCPAKVVLFDGISNS